MITKKSMLSEFNFLVNAFYCGPVKDCAEHEIHEAIRDAIKGTNPPKLIRVINHDHDLEGRNK
jgi:hypothetical protein